MARQRKNRKPRHVDRTEEVPGPTDNPATNLLMADIVIRMGSYVLRNIVERGFLKGRYGKQTARDIVKNRTLKHSLLSVFVAKVATRSMPGAVIVGTGIFAKTLYERGKARQLSRREGDSELLDRADTPSGRLDT